MSVTALMEAARNGDLEGVKRNLNQIGKQAEYGQTALMYAAKNGHSDCIPLLEKEIGMQDNRGWTALMYAALTGNADCVRLLLSEAGKQTTKERKDFLPGTTALMLAAIWGHTNLIPLLKKEIGMQNNDGQTALMLAAFNGHSDCIPLLKEEIGKRDNCGLTALMLAAYNGKTDSVRLLLSEAGKQTTKEWDRFPSGTTALMMAAYCNRSDIVQLLLPYEQGLTDSKGHTAQWYAHNSSKEGDFTRVRKLLENEGTERVSSPREGCLLVASAVTGDIEGIKKHLDHVGYQDPTGTTALMMAAGYGHSDCIPFLEKEIGMQDKRGLTALMLAAFNGHSDCIALLEKEIGMQCNIGQTALMKAALNGKTDCIPLLEKEVGMQDNDGWTALMKAAGNGKADCVRLLFSEAGKQITEEWTDLCNTYPPGMTALMIAAHYNHSEVVELLLNYEQGLKDSEGHTAQWHARHSPRRGDFTQVRKLLKSEGTEQIPPPNHELTNQERINELAAEIESLKKDLSSSKNAHNETKNELSQSNQEVASLKAQLAKTTEDLKRALADQKARILVLEKEVAQLRTESHDMKDLQRRLEEVEEEKRILLQNLAAVGGRLPPAREDSSLISSAIQGDLDTLRRHLDQAGQKDSSGMTALMHAASRGQTEVVRLLRPLEARLQDGRGRTALMHAVGGGHEECVGLLLLERDLKDGEGRTAEDVANGLPDGKKKITPLLRRKVQLPDLPDELSSFQLTGRLGRGAFGTVFSAWSEEHRNCALKVVEYEEMERTIVDSLRREMRTIPSLEHPHVLCYHRVHDDPDNGTAYLVMDWCSGTLLDEVRGRGERGEPFRDDEVWRCLREMASGLAYLHERGLVHRDLKPGNVLLSSDGGCVLGDFGLARATENSSRTKTTAGTPLYMAPEIHREERYDESIDVWALGVMGYELCTGRLPFSNVIAIAVEEPPAIEDRNRKLVDLIVRMLSKDPKDRPTAREVLKEAGGHE
ncbi:Kinase, NEK [Giardia muris]|uniref:Kinase, NEK n=1 Tax=Giardia muris TaxID=5742 RepID=A0A4Z1SZW9_GIAMU|nr:Kinase, NEK [Giardia muris]|eukprot:TNJ27193.1 Kinase, NEK [Giardia muris]